MNSIDRSLRDGEEGGANVVAADIGAGCRVANLKAPAATSDLLAPPFTRRALGKAVYQWADELEIAHAFCEAHGLQLLKTKAAYQVARIVGSDVRLIVYPHTTTGTRNQHLRVRDENSKNKRRAQAVMALLDRAAGFNCTFSCHRTPANRLASQWLFDAIDKDKLAIIEGFAAGTADLLVGNCSSAQTASDKSRDDLK